jgi:quinol monooxygenase YgiN
MRWPKRISIGVGALLALVPLVGAIVANPAAGDPGTTGTTLSSTRDSNHMIKIDLDNNPNLYFRIDNFSVPDAAREEFEAAMRRNMTFIRTLPGFLGHMVFEKSGGPTAFNITTIAVWKNKQALEKASVQVGEYYRRIGFDTSSALARWGVKAEIGTFGAHRKLQ